jgi:hypothetical protein
LPAEAAILADFDGSAGDDAGPVQHAVASGTPQAASPFTGRMAP